MEVETTIDVVSSSTPETEGETVIITSNDPSDTSNRKRKCDHCTEVYSHESARQRHMRTSHAKERAEKLQEKTRNQCLEPGCDQVFFHVKALMEHAIKAHNSVNLVEIEFPRYDDFLHWKINEIEEPNFVSFVKNASTKVNRDAHVKYQYFMCCKNGKRQEFNPKTNKKIKKGYLKQGIFCPARMYVKMIGDQVQVKFFNNHNHEILQSDTVHHQMSRLSKVFIEKQLSLGIPRNKILQQVHGSKVNSRSSDAVLTRKDRINSKTIYTVERRMIGQSGDYRNEACLSRHQKGIALDDGTVHVISADKWCVIPSENCKRYTVKAIERHKKCKKEHCVARCTEALCKGLCAHVYHCSCADPSPLCMHVHKVHSWRNRVFPALDILYSSFDYFTRNEKDSSGDQEESLGEEVEWSGEDENPPSLYSPSVDYPSSDDTARKESADLLCRSLDELKELCSSARFPRSHHTELRNSIHALTKRCSEVIVSTNIRETVPSTSAVKILPQSPEIRYINLARSPSVKRLRFVEGL